MIDEMEPFCTIKWMPQDLRAALEEKGFDGSDENIEKVLNSPRFAKNFQDRLIEEGWEIIYDMIWMLALDDTLDEK